MNPGPAQSEPASGQEGRSFSASAARLAGLATRVLGWRPGEFWDATPAELALSLGAQDRADAPPSRAEMMQLIEREAGDGRRR